MEKQSELFKDDTLRGISLSIKNLQHQETEAKASNKELVYHITKYNPHFRNLINFLDLTFSFGLKDDRRGYWPFVKKVAHSSVVEMIENHKMAQTDIKKGYIWLFLTFIEDSLDSYVRMMVAEKKYMKNFYDRWSLLRDNERCEILFNLLAGLETLSFSIKFEDPYLDYGHDPVLRQEKIIIRVQPGASSLKPPDITLMSNGSTIPVVPDILEGSTRREVSRSPYRKSVSMCENEADNIVITHKSKRHRKRTVSEGDPSVLKQREQEDHDLDKSMEMEEDNFIPEIIGSPEYTVCIPDEPNVLLQTSDPMIKHYSKDDFEYKELLHDYKQDEHTVDQALEEKDPSFTDKVIFNLETSDEHNLNGEILQDAETKLKGLSLHKKEGYQFTYLSDDDQNEETKDELDYGLYRSDSFDRFCRQTSAEDSPNADEQGQLAEQDHSTPPISVHPEISEEGLKRTASPISNSLSRSSIDKLNSARLDTKSGILLPMLPRRPDLKDAIDLLPEITLDPNTKVMISLEIFHDPTEGGLHVFKVFVGHMAGHGYPLYLLVSNLYIYLLKKRDTVQSGFIKLLSVNIDNINKLKTGLNYQDLYIFHDNGCMHVTTADEIVTRTIISTVRSIIKSNNDTPPSAVEEQPLADNTYNELDLVMQDWLICHTQVEEPEISHFSMAFYSLLATSKTNHKVMKAGYLQYKHSLFNVVMSHWESSFFALRGHILNQFSAKKTSELKQSFDLSTQCGGCVRTGSKDNLYTFNILSSDGSTPLLELGVGNENEANDWLINICQVVADAKNGKEKVFQDPVALKPVGIVMTKEKVYLFNQEPKSGRLILEDSCLIQDLTQICVDHDDRTFCTLFIDHHMKENVSSDKTIWLLKFQSEYELGKFEKKLFDAWYLLYQVPLQFIILSDASLKSTIHHVINDAERTKEELGKEMILYLVNTD